MSAVMLKQLTIQSLATLGSAPPSLPHGLFCTPTKKPSMAVSLPRCVDTVIIGTSHSSALIPAEGG